MKVKDDINLLSSDLIEIIYNFKKQGGKIFYGANFHKPIGFDIPKNWNYETDLFAKVNHAQYVNIELLFIASKLIYCKNYIPDIKNPSQNLPDAEAMDIIEQMLEDSIEIINDKLI